jgi:hypothetical protein
MALDERILEDLKRFYRKLEDENQLLVESQLSSYYDNFRKRFGPDRLETLEGENLVDTLHSHANHESLVYWLEFKKADEFDTIRLGSIRGGSALKFGIFRDAGSGAWMGKGPKGKPVEISPEQAIETAEKHRAQLIHGCNLLDALPEDGTDADYEELQEEMDAHAPDVSRLAWGHKYFSLLYPDKLDDYHNPYYQRYHLIKLLQVPSGGNGRYVAAGRYVRIANELGIPVVNLTQILNERDGDPHRYWRVTANYPSYGQDWMNWPAMRDGSFVALGWANLGDLSDISHNQAGKEQLRSLMKSHYNSPGRWTNEIYDFVVDIKAGDLVLAFQTSTVLGIGKVTGSYDFDSSSPAPHRRPVQWLSSAEWELPQQEAQGSAVREIKNYENLVATEKMILDGPGGVNGGAPVRNALNTVLYGPPGTGKTYSGQRRAVQIIDPTLPQDLSPDEVGEKFREYREAERIEFVTFHPSYSYEEFVEGFRYDPNEGIPTLYKGVFRKIAKRADSDPEEVDAEETGDVWKVSLGERGGDPGIFERCIREGEIAVGWLSGIDLTGADKGKISKLFAQHHPGGKFDSTNRLINEMQEGDYVVVYGSPTTTRAIGVITGGYEYKGNEQDGYHHSRPVKWLDNEERDILRINNGVRLTQETIYRLHRVMPQELRQLFSPSVSEPSDKPYVLIIDEINRGNISRIFGELITLLEPDKRRGASNELSARLPYSEEVFAVPPNLYIFGTMNTADRSIALLDVALRRRFEFEELMPDVSIVQRVLEEGSDLSGEQVDLICAFFEIINGRISALLDRDHQIGHSYFLGLSSMNDLCDALYRRIFPLLQEYFYNDHERLERLLGIYDAAQGTGFIERPTVEYGRGFTRDDVDERPWKFHQYDASELETTLRETFIGG